MTLSQPGEAGCKPIGRVVAELSAEFPDITHSSLRFLERERLVEPDRTPGGHRLYSPAHIARIRQIKEWQKERLSLDEIRERLEQVDALASPAELASRFLGLAIGGELAAARETILAADDLGLPLITIFEDVLRPALYSLGDRWEAGELSVGQEKEVSSLAGDLIAELSLRHAADQRPREVVIAACILGEFHELGLRMVTGILQAHGYAVHYLGPSVAPEFLIERIRRRQPAVVLLTATRDELLPQAIDTLETLRHGLPEGELPTIVIGGQIVHNNREVLDQQGVVVAADDSIQTTIASVFTGLNT